MQSSTARVEAVQSGRRGVRVLRGPAAQVALQRGMEVAERVLGPTLGPAGSSVGIARIGRPGMPPELLDDGSTIARRLLGVSDRFANMGLMIVRHVAWQQWLAAGDGTATAAVLCAALHRALLRRLGATSSNIDLRAGLDHAIELAVDAIGEVARPLSGEEIARFVRHLVSDESFADIISQTVTTMGEDGTIVTRDSPHIDVRSQFVDGSLWDTSLPSIEILRPSGFRDLALVSPRILIWDGTLDDVHGLAELLDEVVASGASSLLIVAKVFGPDSLSLLIRNAGGAIRIGAVTAPFQGRNQQWALEDLAVLTGTRIIGPHVGDRLGRELASELGRAKRGILGHIFLSLSPANSPHERITKQLTVVQHLLQSATDHEERHVLIERLGRLKGGMAIIWVGGRTDNERRDRRRQVERALTGLRSAISHGVTIGGGSSYLAAANRLASSDTGRGRFDASARTALSSALEVPLRWIASNAGLNVATALAGARDAAPGFGLDARTGRIVDLSTAGVLDPAATVISALRTSASGAALAISSAALVSRRSATFTSEDFQL